MADASDAYKVLYACSSRQLRSWIMRDTRTSTERISRSTHWLMDRGLLIKIDEKGKRRTLSYFVATELGRNYIIHEPVVGFRKFLGDYKECISNYSESNTEYYSLAIKYDMLNFVSTSKKS